LYNTDKQIMKDKRGFAEYR